MRVVPLRVVASATDLARDLLPFVQTGIKGLDELYDRGVARLRRHRMVRRLRGESLSLVTRDARIPV